MTAPGGFSLSFAGPARKARRVAIHDDAVKVQRHEIVGFDESGAIQTASAEVVEEQAPLVISAQPNTYRAGKYKPSYVPDAAADSLDAAGGIDKFETAEHDTADAQQEVVYGLIRREQPRPESAAAAAGDRDAELQALRRDLQALPPAATAEQYEAMPVDAFASALLRGMGWKEGAGLGKDGKAAPEPRDLKRRPARLGLGATPAPPPSTHKRFIKPGEKREGPENGRAQAEGPSTSSRAASDWRPGQEAAIAGGSHRGSKCVVERVERGRGGEGDRAIVRVRGTRDRVSVRVSDLRTVEGGDGRTSRQRREAPAAADSSDAPPPDTWIVPGIRVKIIDEAHERYLSKGTITAVSTSPRRCSVLLDGDRGQVSGVRQSQLETALPSAPGKPVLVVGLDCRRRGARGAFLERDAERGRVRVRLSGDEEAVWLGMDDVAELA